MRFIRFLCFLTVFGALAAASGGCTWLAQHDQDRVVELARADNDACRDRGYIWPSDAYKECRLDLLNKREYDRWRELDLMRQQQTIKPGEILAGGGDAFRPVRWENFFCEQRTANDGYAYIYCGER